MGCFVSTGLTTLLSGASWSSACPHFDLALIHSSQKAISTEQRSAKGFITDFTGGPKDKYYIQKLNEITH